MSETIPEPLIQECATCGTLIDVSDEEPLALMHCPTCGAAMRVRRAFGHFELLEVLGAGGMGAVYRAQDTSLNRAVALKLLRHEYSEHPEMIQQFAHEAALTAQIVHPNVVKVYSTGSDHGLFFIAMELVDKGSLDDLMTLQGRVGEIQALDVGIQAAQGLRAAFLRGLMHRDVKPGNILFADAHHAKIVDFGLAAPLGADANTGGEVWGTPYYVAPEKLEQPPYEDFRSDIYSLGATLFHAIAGRAPYEAEDASMVALKHLKAQPVSLQAFAPDVASSTAYVINKAMHKDINQRYQSYDELIQHLEYARNQIAGAARGGVPVAVNKTGVRAKAAAGQRVRPRVVMESKGSQSALSFITILMFAALGAGGWFIYQNRDRFFPQQEGPKGDHKEKRKKELEAKERYEAGRRQFLDGKSEEAAETLHKLEAELPNLPQPTLNWTTFHAALASLAAGKGDDAKGDFEKLKNRGPWSADPLEIKFAEFMTKVATEMNNDEATSADVAANIEKGNYEAMALLAYALKDWELRKFDESIALFRQYDSASPEGVDMWAGEYKGLATSFVENYDVFKTFNQKIADLGEPEKAKPELPKLKEELATLKLKGALAKQARSALRKAEQTVEDYEAEQKKAVTEMEDVDAAALTEVRKACEPLIKEFKFKEAQVKAKGAQAITDTGKKKKKELIQIYEWLIVFKSTLISDMSTTPYTGGVRRKVGLPTPGTLADADETNLLLKAGETPVPIPWTGVSYEGLAAIATFYTGAIKAPPDRLADRWWAFGVYSAFEGKTQEAAAAFTQAIKLKPSYEEEWKLFPQVPNPNAKPEAPAAEAKPADAEAKPETKPAAKPDAEPKPELK
jgi:predicted RNA-binding Zn-ribbon protein involved in translation (DUF1610 family)